MLARLERVAGPLWAGCLRGSGAQTQVLQVIVLCPEA